MAKANIVKRIVAYLIDSLIAGALMGVLLIVAIVVMVVGMMVNPAIGTLIYVVVLLVAVVLVLAYSLLKDGLFGGRSPGKKLAGLKVVNVRKNSPCSMKDSVMRNLTFMVPLLNIVECIMPFVDAEGLRFGDKWAGTQVVDV
jgi:uncharacterized RDD family membrane protein YckC